MGQIRGVVSEELEEKFRKLAMEKFGYRKGSLSKALEEALRHWITKNEGCTQLERIQKKRAKK